MLFRAFDDGGTVLAERTFYSIGGGFVLDDTQVSSGDDPVVVADQTSVRYPFRNGDELLAHASDTGLKISDIVMANEMAWHTEEHVRAGAAADLVGDAGMHPGGHQGRRCAARRTEGAPPRSAAGRKAFGRNGFN